MVEEGWSFVVLEPYLEDLTVQDSDSWELHECRASKLLSSKATRIKACDHGTLLAPKMSGTKNTLQHFMFSRGSGV